MATFDRSDRSDWPVPDPEFYCSECGVGMDSAAACELCPDDDCALCPEHRIVQPDGTYLCRRHTTEVVYHCPKCYPGDEKIGYATSELQGVVTCGRCGAEMVAERHAEGK